jgi:hypothetical protein
MQFSLNIVREKQRTCRILDFPQNLRKVSVQRCIDAVDGRIGFDQRFGTGLQKHVTIGSLERRYREQHDNDRTEATPEN